MLGGQLYMPTERWTVKVEVTPSDLLGQLYIDQTPPFHAPLTYDLTICKADICPRNAYETDEHSPKTTTRSSAHNAARPYAQPSLKRAELQQGRPVLPRQLWQAYRLAVASTRASPIVRSADTWA